nr:uncharacterized protein LOC121123500 [Lepeophtheirus salmonis]
MIHSEFSAPTTPIRRWKRNFYGCHPPSITRRYSSAYLPVSPLSKRTLVEFLRPRKLEEVLTVYPGDMLLHKFCQLDPNNVNVEDESLREKIVFAIHAAKAFQISEEEVLLTLNLQKFRTTRLSIYMVLKKLDRYFLSVAIYIDLAIS